MTNNPMNDTFIPMTSVTSGKGEEVVEDVYCLPIQIVNVCFIGVPDQPDDWVLIDAGMPRSAEVILSAAAERFGESNRPKAIILTHGHFDHVGAVVELAEKWKVPVYAHLQERPYLNGEKSYPNPDSTVEGGMIAKISTFFPNEPVDLGSFLRELPSDGTIQELPGWKWHHTPGHTPGHISLFRESDRMLIAGDAFVTVRQDSLYKVVTQKPEVHGPPRYFTPDWKAAHESVQKLEALKPSAVITGHGRPMEGEVLSEGLKNLAENFEALAVPDYGRYVDGEE